VHSENLREDMDWNDDSQEHVSSSFKNKSNILDEETGAVDP
jgi:hypothetical protein